MADYEIGEDSPNGSHFSLRGILLRTGLYRDAGARHFRVAYTNFGTQAMTGYWMSLALSSASSVWSSAGKPLKAAKPIPAHRVTDPSLGAVILRCISCSSRM